MLLTQKDMSFVVTPSEIYFHEFEPHQCYQKTITFKNQTKSARFVHLMPPENRFFRISEPRGGKHSLKVASGLAVTYTIFFEPEEDTDYDCELIAMSESEKFIIPVRAVGSRGRLALPKLVSFPAAPVKATSRTTVLLTNVGTKPCHWRANAVPPFAIHPNFGLVEPQRSAQVVVEVTPTSLQNFDSQIVFDLGNGDTQTMRVTVECSNVDIALSTDSVTVAKTFISLERQTIVAVQNHSDSTVSYTWKAHGSDEEEAVVRQRNASKFDPNNSGPQPPQRAIGNSLQRQLVRRASMSEQALLFDDHVFTIEPIQGSIPAKGSREFVITFNPQLAMSYVATAYLDIQGKLDRLPLVIKGQGLGPQCALSFDSLDLGDIFINSMHEYEVVLENRGSIEAKFVLQPQQTLFGPKFKFTPSAGSVAAGNTQTIKIAFCSDIIGIVSEAFRFHVQGSRDELELHFKGRVIGPTFHFDVEELDFGNVSYNFWHTKTFHLVNTSEIPMRFHLRVPEEGQASGGRKEFEVIPPTGAILPRGRQKIQIDFLSNTVQEYNHHLVVDIDEVGDNLDSLPIKATCIVPDIVVSRDALDYGQCFVGHPYPMEIELRNDTAMSAKYEFILPAEDDPIRKRADIVVGGGDIKERKGIVPARNPVRLKIVLTAKTTGNVHVPLYVRILGSDRAPHHIAISARVTGPKIDVKPKALDFGSVEVLTEVVQPVVIANDSPIPAVFSCKLQTSKALGAGVVAPFTLKVCDGVIKPHSSAHVHIAAFLDEAMKFTDDLIISVQNNNETETVSLTASGKGYTLKPSVPMDLIDFGDLFTTKAEPRTFTIQNHGRKPQQVQWNNDRGKAKEGDPPIVFSIAPERAIINGKSEESFTITALSSTKGVFSEKFSCKLSQSHKLVFKATVQANFQPPMLQYSTNQIQFNYVYSPDNAATFVSSRPLTMKNVSPLDLDFNLKVIKQGTEPGGNPFTLDQQDFSLRRGESAVVNVSFDAAYRGDRVSHKTSAKLLVTFANHGHKDNLTLVGELQFPNVQLDTNMADFGCILNDTEQRKVITITNPSKVVAHYTWVFEEEVENSARTKRSDKDTLPAVPVNSVFDLVPFRGVIAPGATERAEVLFNGVPGRKMTATAVCQVDGGPEYPLQLIGEASSIQYKFDRVVLDFGSQEHDDWQEKDLTITNTGRVPFLFQVDLSIVSRPGMLEVSPLSGLVKDRAKLTVRFSPRVPDRVDDFFKIQVAHFEPQVINVKGFGLYSSLVLMPAGPNSAIFRNDPPSFKPYLAEARSRVSQSSGQDSKPSTAPRPTPGASPVHPPVPTDNIDPVVAEAERLYFRDIITEDAIILKSLANNDDPRQVEMALERTNQIKRKAFNGETKYILSRYVLDLGPMIRGETTARKKSFKIVNSSTMPITLSVDRRHLANTGLTLTPDKFPKLAPMGSVTVEASLNTRLKAGLMNLGPMSIEVLLDIKGGPIVLLEVRALIIVPTADISTDRCDFGQVQVGMTRIIPIALENPLTLPAEWSVAYLPDETRKKNEKHGRFVCQPERGLLHPRQKTYVHVSFIPAITETLTQKISFRVNQNPKFTEVTCVGTGEELQLEVSPNTIDLTPVFPYQQSRRVFQLINHSSVPVEVFSLNFDEKYVVEEDILRNAEEHFVNNVLLLPPREVGAALPDFLMEAYFNKLMAADKQFTAADLMPIEEGMAKPIEPEKPPTVQPSVPLPPLELPKDDSEVGKAPIVVVIGPPLSGKTTHAAGVAKAHNMLLLTMDALLGSIMELDTAEGAALRTLSHKAADGAKAQDLSPALLVSAIRMRMRGADAAQGVVFDDLVCALTSNPDLMLSALRDCATSLGGSPFHVAVLTVDELLIAVRQAEIGVAKAQAALDQAVTHPLPEDEYDRLDDAGKRTHDRALKHYRDCKRALSLAQDKLADLVNKRNKAKSMPGKPVLPLHEEADKDLADEKEREEASKRKPPPKKGAVVEAPPAPKWEELGAIARFKQLYMVCRNSVDDHALTVVNTNRPVDEALKSITDKVVAVLPPNLSKLNTERTLASTSGGDSASLNATLSGGGGNIAVATPQGEAPGGMALVESILLSPSSGQSLSSVTAPVTRQRIERPPERRSYPARFFKVLTPDSRPVAVAGLPPVAAGPGKKPMPPGAPLSSGRGITAAVTSSANVVAGTGDAQTAPAALVEDTTRWIILPHSSVDLTLQYCSDEIGSTTQQLIFGVVGSTQEFPLTCRTACACPEIVRDPKTIFNKKIKARVEGDRTTTGSKAYITSKKMFEFGPLLVLPPKAPPNPKDKGAAAGKASAAAPDAGAAQIVENRDGSNCEKMHFTNCGLFPVEANLYFEDEKCKSFAVVPDHFTLAPGESIDVSLIAQPEVVGEIKTAVIVCIKDNPEPLRVDISCLGSRPDVLLEGKKDALVEFGRLLLRRREERKISMRNLASLRVKYNVVGAEKLPPEIKLESTSGVLEPTSETPLSITFISERANVFNATLKVEISDVDGTQIYETLSLVIKGEAHDVFLEWTKELDFKTVKVGESRKEVIRAVNKGPYEVAYSFKVPKRLAEVLTITPMEGTLRGMSGFKEAQVVAIEVVFKTDRETQIGRRVGLDGVELSFIEPNLKELVYPVQRVLVRGEALYNKFQIKPLQINFGPCLQRQKKQATFDIVNTGCFELRYKLFSLKDGLGAKPDVPEPVVDPKKKGGATAAAEKKSGKKDAQPDVQEVQLGAFTLSPSIGVVPIGGTTTVTVSIIPEGSHHFHEVLGIHIEDRDPSIHSDGIPFELEAESCVPGIVADLDSPEADSIFEEQQIVSRLDGFKKMQSVFARDDRVFSFGIALSGRRLVERFRLSNPVKVPCTVSVTLLPRGDAADAKVAAEAFDIQALKAEGGKITIGPHEHRYVTVGFTPSSLNPYGAIFEATVEGGLDPKTKQLRFELRGEGSLPNIAVEVPPPPVKLIDVLAAPADAASGKGAAGGKGGKAPAPKPSTSKSAQAADDSDKVPPNTLIMQRTIVGIKSTRFVTVRNVGDLPASLRFALPTTGNPAFTFPSRNEDILLAPGSTERYPVHFEPPMAGDFHAKLSLVVQDNHYEDTVISLLGEGFIDHLAFRDVDENTENRLSLGDCYVGQAKSKAFSLHNHTSHVLRFAWVAPNANFKVSPATGHIAPKSSKKVDVSYLSNVPATETCKCSVTCQAIELAAFNGSARNAPIPGEWDDRVTVSKWIAEADEQAAGSPDDVDMYEASRRPLRKVVEQSPEPAHTLVQELPAKDLVVVAVCDVTSYDIALQDDSAQQSQAKTVAFRRTKIFQQRRATLIVKNSGKVTLPFDFTLLSMLRERPTEDELKTVVVAPSNGVVAPGQTQEIGITFRPLTTDDIKLQLVGKFPFGAKPEHTILVTGSSECPLVHFELPPTEYLATRESDLPAIDPSSCVFEIFSRGIKMRSTARFMVLNPTNMGYEFEWVEKLRTQPATGSSGSSGAASPPSGSLAQQPAASSSFRCQTPRGAIHSGKKFEMIFEFTPETARKQESTWTLNIIGKAAVPFLLVGHVSEPDVFFSLTRMQFGQVIVGAKSQQIATIENREPVPYAFQFEKLAPNAAITVTPAQGTVPPNGSLPVEVVFSPKAEEQYNYTLACRIKKSSVPITCNVKGEGYVTHDSIRIQMPDGGFVPIVSGEPATLPLGTVQVNGKITRRLLLSNAGRYNMDYKWIAPSHPFLTLSPVLGTVLPGQDSAIDVTFAPTKDCTVMDHKLVCKVTNGRTYTVNVTATAAAPNVSLSWKEYDFGPVFLQSAASSSPTSTSGSTSPVDLQAPVAILTMINRDKTSLAVDCLFDNKDFLEVDVSSFVLQSGEKKDIRVTFAPRESVTYQETITFSLNDLTTVAVLVKGEGTTPKIEVLTKQVRFGVLRIGEKKEVEVRVACRSKVATAISLEGCVSGELTRLGVAVSPDGLVYLKPKEVGTFLFSFRPQARLRPFTHDMRIRVVGVDQPFVSLSGSCQGAEVHLDNKQITFGPTVVGTRVTKKVTIMNTGDLALDFNWNEKRLAPDFTMSPLTGVIASHQEVVCELTYQPTEAGRDGRRDNVELRFNDAPALNLQILGAACVEKPSTTDSVSFACRVRETATNKVIIKNDSTEPWTLRPVIDNSSWSGADQILIRARESAEYVMTYAPQVCTKLRADGANDIGSLFVPLPTGSALMYKLDGCADYPAVSAPPVEREITAKTQFTEKFAVHNWLKAPQRFNVTMKWNHDPSDDSVVIKGVPSLDVPPNASRDYKVQVLCFKEGRISGTIHFTNEETKEYQFYNVVFVVKAGKEGSTIELKTPCRVRTSNDITLSNPLGKQVTLAVKCDNPDLIVAPTVILPPKATQRVTVEFFPLVAKEHPPARLVFSCPELGEFLYTAMLSAVAPSQEKPIRMSCALGQLVSSSLRFVHYSKVPTDFTFKFSDPKQTTFLKSNGQLVLKVNACADVRVGQDVSVDVTFEPGKVGDFKETVEVVSPTAGTYSFLLMGTCTPPQRQGPIDIRPNQTAQIPFKNVFAENVTFTFVADQPQFVVVKASELVPSKKATVVAVTYKPDDSSNVLRGKLVVTGTTAADPTPVSWVYYLRGLRDCDVDTSSPAPAPPGAKKK